jgi:uncharacterized protein YdbL (DUF1318 family)
MQRRNLAACLGFAVLLVLALPAPALSLELESAKRDGLIGERADGFVGVVVAKPTQELQQLVDSVNAKRRAKYQQIAKQNGTSLDAVAGLAGEKLVQRAAKGEYVTDAQGNWYQKK